MPQGDKQLAQHLERLEVNVGAAGPRRRGSPTPPRPTEPSGRPPAKTRAERLRRRRRRHPARPGLASPPMRHASGSATSIGRSTPTTPPGAIRPRRDRARIAADHRPAGRIAPRRAARDRPGRRAGAPDRPHAQPATRARAVPLRHHQRPAPRASATSGTSARSPRAPKPSEPYSVRAAEAAIDEIEAWGGELLVVKGDVTVDALAHDWERFGRLAPERGHPDHGHSRQPRPGRAHRQSGWRRRLMGELARRTGVAVTAEDGLRLVGFDPSRTRAGPRRRPAAHRARRHDPSGPSAWSGRCRRRRDRRGRRRCAGPGVRRPPPPAHDRHRSPPTSRSASIATRAGPSSIGPSPPTRRCSSRPATPTATGSAATAAP